jgi:hypothetical protein
MHAEFSNAWNRFVKISHKTVNNSQKSKKNAKNPFDFLEKSFHLIPLGKG